MRVRFTVDMGNRNGRGGGERLERARKTSQINTQSTTEGINKYTSCHINAREMKELQKSYESRIYKSN